MSSFMTAESDLIVIYQISMKFWIFVSSGLLLIGDFMSDIPLWHEVAGREISRQEPTTNIIM